MKKKNCFLFVFIFSLFVANLFASQNDKENNDLKKGMFKAPQALGPEDIIFVNTGEMNIAGSQLGSNGGGGVIYIPQSVQMLDEAGASQTNVKVVLNGDLYVGGNFYQDTKGTVFELGTDKTVTDNEGTVHFIDYVGPGINGTGINGSKHEITTTALSKDPDSLAGYDRYREYIAFPHVRIETNDSIVLDARMGMDALHVKKGIPDSKGTLVLESGVYKSSTGNECVYDASLRIFGEGNSESLVDESAVIVKKDVSKYRVPTGAQKPQLFPFATPFKKQLAGYFAGNWVRVPTIDVSDNYHTKYVLGNKPQDEDDPNNNKIAHDQYERYALRYLKPGNPYLIRLRPSDFDYSTLNGADDLSVTKGGSNNFDKYKTNKFVFNGSPYGITQDEAKKEYKEQLFADDALLEYEFKGFVPNSNKTLNWVIGNSYTCPISLDKLGQGMQNAEGITFSNTVYIYSFGSQGYVPVKIYDAQQSILLTLPDVGIPAMGVFMVRVSKKSTPSFPGKPFRIDKGMLMHSTTDNSLVDFTGNNGKKPAPSKLENQVRLTMTPENNDFVYDKIAVGLRTDASLGNDNYDAEKIFNNVDDGFQLYTVSSSLTKLSI
ncbi:MAG: hypothetical protein LBH80_08775, partial [Prevotellaceae bacterium]|nr:hypothetical protein [Prevotellaceae bacterium]